MALAALAQTPHQRYSFRRRPDHPFAGDNQAFSPHHRQDAKKTDKSSRPIRCSRCQLPLTSSKETAFINTRHRHVFFNPAGLLFNIRCFYQAPGVRITGEKSSEFTWFAGYAWQLGVCRSCGVHLGWFFSGADVFHALIVDRLMY